MSLPFFILPYLFIFFIFISLMNTFHNSFLKFSFFFSFFIAHSFHTFHFPSSIPPFLVKTSSPLFLVYIGVRLSSNYVWLYAWWRINFTLSETSLLFLFYYLLWWCQQSLVFYEHIYISLHNSRFQGRTIFWRWLLVGLL